MWADLRQAVRGLRREPVFTLVAVASIALAVGVNAAIFGVIDALWFRPPGVADPGRLTWIFSTTKQDAKGGFSWPEYTELRDRAKSVDAVVALGRRGTSLYNAEGPPDMLLVNVVSTNFFPALGVRAHALLAYKTRTSRMTAALTGALAILGVLLTAIGVYGVVAYGVAQRTQEIGIRLALGASRAGTVRLIVGDGLRMLLMGVVAGIPLAVTATTAMKPLLVGVDRLDIGGILLAIAVLTVAVLAASLGPAMRAAAVNPAYALRD